MPDTPGALPTGVLPTRDQTPRRPPLLRDRESIPVVNGALALGRWQAVYLFEHRTAPHTREVVVHLLGE